MGTGWSQDKVLEPNGEGGKVRRAERNPANDEATITTTESKFPHNHEDILKDADTPIDKSSAEKLYAQLDAGVFLTKLRKKYWIDRNSKNCFMLLAKDLSITWAENSDYWHKRIIQESSEVSLEVAELLKVCWLEVHGRFNTINLTPQTLYEVLFVVMMKDPAYGWSIPVNLRLTLADGTRQEHKENMTEKPRGCWIEVLAGEFKTLPENTGEMEISLYEYEGGIWKRGLIIKGIVIRPKN